ncbi:hypothetical protein D3C72_2445470 [compost metagenome]
MYLTNNSLIVVFASGSITLNNRMLNKVEIARAIIVVIKKVVKASLKEKKPLMSFFVLVSNTIPITT